MKQQSIMFLQAPINQTAEILYELLSNSNRQSFKQLYSATGILGVSQRISDLRSKGLDVLCVEIKGTNKHGRKCAWGTWSVQGETEKALEVYKAINEKAE